MTRKRHQDPEADAPAPEASPAPAPEPAAAEPASAPEPDPAAARLAELSAQLAAAEDRRLRLAAEFDNFRKRAARELQEARTAARLDTLLAVLGVFDHFRLAMAAADADHDPKVLRDGMTMILAEFEKALAELGVEAIEAVGQPFDPQCHEASAREPSATVPENQVLRQWRCGYRLGGRLIRPAAVVVSAGPPPAPATPAAEEAG